MEHSAECIANRGEGKEGQEGPMKNQEKRGGKRDLREEKCRAKPDWI
jgi:hypothetical protein